jgi:thiamine biosynthesis protein ThiS
MTITINGNLHDVDTVRTVAELLDQLRVPTGSALVEQNGNVVDRATFRDAVVQEGDTIEIIQMVAGG